MVHPKCFTLFIFIGNHIQWWWAHLGWLTEAWLPVRPTPDIHTHYNSTTALLIKSWTHRKPLNKPCYFTVRLQPMSIFITNMPHMLFPWQLNKIKLPSPHHRDDVTGIVFRHVSNTNMFSPLSEEIWFQGLFAVFAQNWQKKSAVLLNCSQIKVNWSADWSNKYFSCMVLGGFWVSWRWGEGTVGIWIEFDLNSFLVDKRKSAHTASFTRVASFHSPESPMWTPPWGQWFNLSPTNTSCVCVFSVDYVIHTKSSSFQLWVISGRDNVGCAIRKWTLRKNIPWYMHQLFESV